jgi:hypothetical protein
MEKKIQRGRRIKEQLSKFITRSLPDSGKVGNRFIHEMSYGILKISPDILKCRICF